MDECQASSCREEVEPGKNEQRWPKKSVEPASLRNDADDHGRLRGRLKRRRRSATAERLDRLRSWRNDCDDPSEFPGDLVAIPTAAIDAAEYVIGSLLPPTT